MYGPAYFYLVAGTEVNTGQAQATIDTSGWYLTTDMTSLEPVNINTVSFSGYIDYFNNHPNVELFDEFFEIYIDESHEVPYSNDSGS